MRLIKDCYEFLGSQHIAYVFVAYVFVYHGVTSLENTPQPMQLCFYFTLSAKKLFQWIFSWLSPFFQRKTWDAYNFLDTDTTFANFFVRSQPNYLKLFCAKKHTKKEIQHPHDCFCNLESWNKGAWHSDILVTFYKNLSFILNNYLYSYRNHWIQSNTN